MPVLDKMPDYFCQESFQLNNISSCLRYTDLVKCSADGQANHLNYICVDKDSVGVSAYSTPQPNPLTGNPFYCSLESCPNVAPDNNVTTNTSTSAGTKASAMSEKTLTLSGALILALLASQMVLF